MSIRVAIVEDDRNVRDNLAVLIGRAPGYTCVATCASAEQALRELPSLAPNVTLMDIHLPGLDGIGCVAQLRTTLPAMQIIMLTIEEDSEKVFDSMKAGATGYLVKHASTDEILRAIADVHQGGAPMSGKIARKVVMAFRRPMASGPPDVSLSPREEQVLRFLAKGHRTKEIADALGIGATTVNTYVRNIYEKLHVRSRAEAVARLVSRG